LWWLARDREGIVLTTSPTQRQVRTQLWSEIHRLVERATVPYPKLKTTELKFRGDNNFAIGFSTNQAENFQGYHGKYVLIIADEAPGIDSGIWDAVAGTMAGGKVHIVMAGNPTTPSGAFFDAFTTERGLWNCITIGAFDSPNLSGLELEQLLRLDPAEGGSLDQNPFPYLVEPVVEELGHRAVDGLLHPPPERVVAEARCCWSAGGAQMIARVPGVRVGVIRAPISIAVIAQAGAVELALHVVGVVRRAGPRDDIRGHTETCHITR